MVLLCNVANSPFAWFPRLFGKPVVLNVDGLDRQRGKWNALGQATLHFCEWMSVFTPTRVVTDAKPIQDYYRTRYHKQSTLIGYGSDIPPGDHKLDGFNLQPGHYVLYVSRLEPENNPELVLDAWRKVRSDWPLVMVGDNRYDGGYVERLKQMADDRVMFLGAIYGDGYWALQKTCRQSLCLPAKWAACIPRSSRPWRRRTPCSISIRPRTTRPPATLRFDSASRPMTSQRSCRRCWTIPRRVSNGPLAPPRVPVELYRWDDVAEQYEKLFEEVLQQADELILGSAASVARVQLKPIAHVATRA